MSAERTEMDKQEPQTEPKTEGAGDGAGEGGGRFTFTNRIRRVRADLYEIPTVVAGRSSQRSCDPLRLDELLRLVPSAACWEGGKDGG